MGWQIPDGDAWSPIDAGFAPRRLTHTVVYDPPRHRLISLFGSDGSYQNDVWVLPLDPTGTWTRLVVTGTLPSPRRLVTAIYDPERDRLVVFGGFDDHYFNDVYALSLSGTPAWTRLFPGGGPPVAGAGHSAIYDPARDRMLVIFGHDGFSLPSLRRDDVWALSLSGTPGWTRLSISGTPPSPRSSFTAVYDANHDRVLIFGGTDPDYRNDTWELKLGAAPAWNEISRTMGRVPDPRESHSSIYDPVRNELVIFGGIDARGIYGDTWILTMGDRPRWFELAQHNSGPVARWGHGAVYDADHRRMVVYGGWSGWYMSDAWGFSLDGPSLSSVPVQQPVDEDGGQQAVPAGPRLALRVPGVWRDGALTLGLRLSGPDPARLEVLDLAGRRLERHDVGPGSRALTLASRPSPGTYFARLVQGGRAVTARIIVTR